VDQAAVITWNAIAGTKTRDEARRDLARSATRSSASIIYLDSLVALTYLLSEDRYPTNGPWDQPIISSRLLECEVWNRINTRRLADSHGDLVRTSAGSPSLKWCRRS
jgi:hypothetical protein